MLKVKKGLKKFYIGQTEEDSLAHICYDNFGEFIKADHTHVSDELKGKSAGKLILKEMVDWARSENKKIMPICPFVKAQMEKHEEYQNMIYKE